MTITRTIIGQLTEGHGRLIASNGTATPLADGASFTGDWEDVSQYDSIVSAIATDQITTVKVQFSTDQTNVDSTLTFTFVPSRINPPHRVTVTRQFARVLIENNSGSAQTFMRHSLIGGAKQPLSLASNAIASQDYDSTIARVIGERLNIALGLFQGYTSDEKFGANGDIDTGTEEDIWAGGGDYTGQPTTGSAETIDVFSSSADDAAAGTGARTLRLFGLDEDYNEITEDVTLNGTTPVVTTQTFWRMDRMRVLTAGATGVSQGSITARHTTTTANVFAVMPAGKNRTQVAATTVPAGKKRIVISFYAGLGRNTASGAADVFLMGRPLGGVYEERGNYTATIGGPVDRTYAAGKVFHEKEDIKVRASVTANNTSITAELSYITVDVTPA